MREYKGRKVLGYLSARIMPEKNSVLPDCICVILLTADILYVLEDDYSGGAITHFAIPCSRIKRVEQYKSDPGRLWNTVDYLLGGIFHALFQGAVKDDILLLVFHDGTEENRHLFFNEAGGSIRRFSKAFQKLKSSRML